MNEPRRLLDDGADEFERDLLASARKDAGSDRALGRTLSAIGAGLGASLVKGTASGAVAIGLGLKWGAIGAIGGAIAISGYAAIEWGVLRPHGEMRPVSSVARIASTAPAMPAASVPAPVAEEPAPLPTEMPPARARRAEPAPVPALEPAPSAAPPADETTTLAAEVQSLGEAQTALDRGSPRLALDRLDRHDRAFPRGRLEPEAAVLRVRALIRSGDRGSAQRLGNAYLAEHPTCASAVVLRSLLAADSAP
jgi:hypothetical protein